MAVMRWAGTVRRSTVINQICEKEKKAAPFGAASRTG
jgi:hypothetical protein